MNATADEMIADVEELVREGKPVPEKGHRYRIRIDEERFVLSDPHPTGRYLLALVHKRPCSEVLVQIIRGRDDEFVDPDETVDLVTRGVERFAVVARDVVVVSMDGNDVKLPRGTVTVAELKRLGGVADAYALDQNVGGRLVPLEDDGSVTIHGCEVFESSTQRGGAS